MGASENASRCWSCRIQRVRQWPSAWIVCAACRATGNPKPQRGCPLRAIGGDFNSPDLWLLARRVILQNEVGVLDVMGIRLSMPPHSVAPACIETSTEASKNRGANSVFLVNRKCLPMVCQQLRKLFPSRDALRDAAPTLVKHVLEYAWASVDIVERGHAQMRLDLQSSGLTPPSPPRPPRCV